MPPTPANYAQRVGRAGRGPRAWYAIGVVWCDDGRSHDMFFFQQPEETRLMLSGQVLSPQMNVTNPSIVRRHLFAAVLQDRLGHGTVRKQFSGNPEALLAGLPANLLCKFSECLDCVRELQESLGPYLRQGLTRQEWYSSGLAPDYGFRHDEVKLILEDPEEKDGPTRSVLTGEISKRPPEEAVTVWYPDRPVATPMGLMRIERGYPDSKDVFQVNVDGREIKVQKCLSFRVKREEGFVGSGDRMPNYNVRVEFQVEQLDHAGENLEWISWFDVQSGKLTMVNFGPSRPDSDIQMKPNSEDPWGFQAYCDGFLVCFDADVLGKTGVASLACVLDHAVQRYFRINDSDLLLLDRFTCGRVPPPFKGLLLADVAGRGVVDMARLSRDFRCVLQAAFHRLTACHCEAGCFRCLRTYATNRFATIATRETAVRLVAAMLGIDKWHPPLPQDPFALARRGSQAIVTVNLHGNVVRWGSPKATGEIWVGPGEDEKRALRAGLVAALRSFVPEYSSELILRTNRPYFGRLIEGLQKKKPDFADLELFFLLLAFRNVRSR